MFDIFALIFAIFCLLIMLYLRAVLAFTFNKISAQILNEDPAEEIADLLPKIKLELQALGFNGPFQVGLNINEGDQVYKRTISIFKNPEANTLLWCHCSQTPAIANNMLMYWTTMLEDKSVIVSQAFDAYFQLVATELMPAHTITGKTLSKQFDQHKTFLQSFECAADHATTEDHNIIYQASEVRNLSLDKLASSGKILKNSQGLLKPSFIMALKLLWKILTRTKEAAISGGIPVARLVTMAEDQKIFREREPRVIAQWGMVTISILFSIAIAAYFWDIQFAIIIMLVILFHEMGHYFAMRLFGYKNVHIMALPLVGGVTMGFDTKPSAWRQAWMSLMGPLPGILIGWGSVIWFMVFDPAGLSQDWVFMTVLILFVVNYLNILPVLPLDGGHIVSALIPPRSLKLKGILIIVVCSVGAILAFHFEFYILVLLALLQFLTIPSQFKISQIVKDLHQKQIISSNADRSEQLHRIFEELEKTEDTSKTAAQSIKKAESILQVLIAKPMKGWQRTVIIVVYSLLLIVPIGALVFSFSGIGNSQSDLEWEITETNRQERLIKFNRQASSKAFNELVTDLNNYYQSSDPIIAASEQDILAKQNELGRVIPDHIKAFYRVTNGLKELGIAPISKINIAKNTPLETLKYYNEQGHINALLFSNKVDEDDYAEQSVSIDEVKNWLSLSDPESDSDSMFVELSDEIKNTNRVLYLWEGAVIYPSFQAWLENQWVSIQESKHYTHQLLRATEKEFLQLTYLSIPELIDTYQKANEPSDTMQWLLKMILLDPEQAPLPSLSKQSEIEATENRLNVRFTASLLEMYHLHNGLPTLTILPLATITPVNKLSQPLSQYLVPNAKWNTINAKGVEEPSILDQRQMNECLIIGGIKPYGLENLIPLILWCPNSKDQTIVDLQNYHLYSDFKHFIHYIVAHRLAIERAF